MGVRVGGAEVNNVVARWAGGALILTVLAFTAQGCNQVEPLSFAPAPPQSAPPSSAPEVTLANGTGVRLPAVPGLPTTTAVQLLGGGASISGTAVGPLGPLAGATVLAERVVGAAVGSLTAITGPDGSFSLRGLQGGVYQVRAWEAPAFAMTTPTDFFLSGLQTHPLILSLSSFATVAALGVVNPDPPVVGQPANLAIQVTMATVGVDGIVRHPVLPAATVVLTNDPGWEVARISDLVITGNNGEAVFTVTCLSPGQQPLDASINGQVPVSLQLAGCRPPPPTTTAAPPTTSSTTTTTTAGVPGTTTTTITTGATAREAHSDGKSP